MSGVAAEQKSSGGWEGGVKPHLILFRYCIKLVWSRLTKETNLTQPKEDE